MAGDAPSRWRRTGADGLRAARHTGARGTAGAACSDQLGECKAARRAWSGCAACGLGGQGDGRGTALLRRSQHTDHALGSTGSGGGADGCSLSRGAPNRLRVSSQQPSHPWLNLHVRCSLTITSSGCSSSMHARVGGTGQPTHRETSGRRWSTQNVAFASTRSVHNPPVSSHAEGDESAVTSFTAHVVRPLPVDIVVAVPVQSAGQNLTGY